MHNNVSSELTLQQVNDKEVRKILPVIVVIFFLMIIGLIGNPLVIYFYGFKQRRRASFMLIITLACFDFMTCTISMPLEIVDLFYFFTFPNAEACRVVRFISHFAIFGSGSTLTAIAVDRFRRVCCPFKKQISRKYARCIILLVFVFAVCCASPALAFYTVVEFNITSEHNMTGFDCTSHRDEAYRTFINVYNIYCFILFIITILVLIVLYSLIVHQMYKLKDRQSKRLSSFIVFGKRTSSRLSKRSLINRQSTVKSQQGDQTETSFDSKNCNVTSLPTTEEQNGMSRKSESEHHESRNLLKESFKVENIENPVGDALETPVRHTPGEQKVKAQKFTVITLLISLMFAFNFLPYLLLVTWRSWNSKYEPNELKDSELVAFETFIRSFLFSSACNPVINGLLNTQFRNMITAPMKRICCRKQK